MDRKSLSVVIDNFSINNGHEGLNGGDAFETGISMKFLSNTTKSASAPG
jgi:hypothetical protein